MSSPRRTRSPGRSPPRPFVRVEKNPTKEQKQFTIPIGKGSIGIANARSDTAFLAAKKSEKSELPDYISFATRNELINLYNAIGEIIDLI